MCTFLNNPEMRAAWIKQIQRQNWNPTQNSMICQVYNLLQILSLINFKNDFSKF